MTPEAMPCRLSRVDLASTHLHLTPHPTTHAQLQNQAQGAEADTAARVQMLKVEGPVLAMASPMIQIAANQTQALIPVTLSGPSMLPVSVAVSAPQQLTLGSSAVTAAAGKLQTPSLTWASGQAGQRVITLDLDPSADMQSAAVLVQLAQPQNADLDPVKHATLVTGLSAADLTATFSYTPNQVPLGSQYLLPRFLQLHRVRREHALGSQP